MNDFWLLNLTSEKGIFIQLVDNMIEQLITWKNRYSPLYVLPVFLSGIFLRLKFRGSLMSFLIV